jgi:hypothetical protein
VWTAFLSVIFLFPTVMPVTPTNVSDPCLRALIQRGYSDLLTLLQMNYAVVILAFVFLLSVVYWFIHGRFYYTGPRTQARVVGGVVVNVAPQPGAAVVDEEQVTKEVQ